MVFYRVKHTKVLARATLRKPYINLIFYDLSSRVLYGAIYKLEAGQAQLLS